MRNFTKFLLAGMVLAFPAACSPSQQAGSATLLTANGLAPATAQVIVSDAAIGGQLFCQFGPTLAAIAGVKVNGATSAAVNSACANASIPGIATTAVPVPVAAPTGAAAVVAVTTPEAAAAVTASVALSASGQ